MSGAGLGTREFGECFETSKARSGRTVPLPLAADCSLDSSIWVDPFGFKTRGEDEQRVLGFGLSMEPFFRVKEAAGKFRRSRGCRENGSLFERSPRRELLSFRNR